MNCLIIDDEAPARFLMEDLLQRMPMLKLRGTCRNAYEAMETLQQEKIDLIFLDIEMPEISGLELLRNLPEKPMVIFVTAYKKYALEGYELNVIDYLLKPVQHERFLASVNKAMEFYRYKNSQVVQPSSPDYFFVHSEYQLVKVIASRIRYIEVVGDYVKIFTDDAHEPISSKKTLKRLEEYLQPPDFLRVQKSFIVNTNKITSIQRNRVNIGGKMIPFSESKREALFRIIDPEGRRGGLNA